MAKPMLYDPAMGDTICERLMHGQSLRTITMADDVPSASTIFKWLRENETFAQQYARAREAQADTLADEMLDIADDGSNDWMAKYDDEGGNIGWRENGEAVARSRLRLDTRKWIASKLKPKVYGDKLDLTSDGEALTRASVIEGSLKRAQAYLDSGEYKQLLLEHKGDDE